MSRGGLPPQIRTLLGQEAGLGEWCCARGLPNGVRVYTMVTVVGILVASNGERRKGRFGKAERD